jgi:hypothetical protein
MLKKKCDNGEDTCELLEKILDGAIEESWIQMVELKDMYLELFQIQRI